MDYKQLSRIADSKIIDGSDVKRAELLAEKWGDEPKRWMVAWKKHPTIERAKVFADKANELNFAAVAEQFSELKEFADLNKPVQVTNYQALEETLSKYFEKFSDAVYSVSETYWGEIDSYLSKCKATTSILYGEKTLLLEYYIDSDYPDEIAIEITIPDGKKFLDEGELADAPGRAAGDIAALLGIESDWKRPHSDYIKEYLGI